RLKYDRQPPFGVNLIYRLKNCLQLRRMVRIVVDINRSLAFNDVLEPALNPFKTCQGRFDRYILYTACAGGSDGRNGIFYVMQPGYSEPDIGDQFFSLVKIKIEIAVQHPDIIGK